MLHVLPDNGRACRVRFLWGEQKIEPIQMCSIGIGQASLKLKEIAKHRPICG
jgi:hypothetical protein